MKERPIIFTGPMVRAIQEGRKTQTRRVVKPRKDLNVGCMLSPGEIAGEVNNGCYMNCPYGAPKNRLWVRETWSQHPRFADIAYRADGEEFEDSDGFLWEPKWKPSIHMPRSASRITLQITGIRAERLQDLTENDSIHEGLKGLTKDGHLIKFGIPDRDGWPGTDNYGWPWAEWKTDPRQGYRRLWESINGPGSWDKNPWVWVIEFSKCDAAMAPEKK